MKLTVTQLYTAVACNRTPEIADWNDDGTICFGATNAVVIYDTNIIAADPLTVLSHHRSKVNSVKWLRKTDGTCSELVSCSADKTTAIWTLKDGQWQVTSTLTGHTDGVTSIFGIYAGDVLIVYTGSIDSTIKVWERKNGTTTLKQTINLNSGLCLSIHAHILPGTNEPLLFCALDDHKVHIFSGTEEYHRVHTLVGHEDWVRGLDVLDVDEDTIMVASASQDTYIRLWRIQRHVKRDTEPGIKVELVLFPAHNHDWSVKLEAVLAGHEGWVYGVNWHPCLYEDNKKRPVYRLLSSSLDKTLIVWSPSEDGVWTEAVRVGEVGGNGLGFYGGRFGPRGQSIMGHGYNGSFHIWKLNKNENRWEPQPVCGGHYAPISDARWEPRGRYLLTASADQTTRAHAPWKREQGEEWHELARPQVHGYDLSSLAPVSATCFVSAAEEKVIRVFRAPVNFRHNFCNIVGETIEGDGGPEGASVPSLGLSNKAVFADDHDHGDDNDGYFTPVNLTEPPTEETLIQQTLWPEERKLYGHGNEVHAMCASADGGLVASAARAACAEHGAVRLWDTTTWQQIQELVSHQLTVTQLEFSPDSRHLLTVSRDRRWTLFQRREGSNLFDIAATTDKTNGVHSRIIWCCSWSYDSSVFATGSRDGKVCVWGKSEPTETSLKNYGLHGKPLELKAASVTALAFAPLVSADRVLAVGLEAGNICLYKFDNVWSLMYTMDNSLAHHLTVRRLSFRPTASDRPLQLASCGNDNLVRIYNVVIS